MGLNPSPQTWGVFLTKTHGDWYKSSFVSGECNHTVPSRVGQGIRVSAGRYQCIECNNTADTALCESLVNNQHAWGLGQSFGRAVSRTDEPQPDGSVPSRVGKAVSHSGSGVSAVARTARRRKYQQPTCIGIGIRAKYKPWGRSGQSQAVLGVKPAIEDVDAGSFLAFLPAFVEDRIESNTICHYLTQLEILCL